MPLIFKKVLLFFFLFFSISLPAFALEAPYDHSKWNEFIEKFVDEEGNVDYAAVKQDPSLLKEYIETFKHIDKGDFNSGWPREELLAFWINVYNASVINIIQEHYPLKKGIQDIPGVWELRFIQVIEAKYSLNQVHKGILLKQFRDEKIHTALACGARSCPKLFPEAFTGPRVEGQLFLAAKRFVNDPVLNVITPGEKKIKLSRIFKWYGADFKLDFGRADNDRGLHPVDHAVLSFIANYLNNSEKVLYLEEGNYKIKYLNFDWSLNDSNSNTVAA